MIEMKTYSYLPNCYFMLCKAHSVKIVCDNREALLELTKALASVILHC